MHGIGAQPEAHSVPVGGSAALVGNGVEGQVDRDVASPPPCTGAEAAHAADGGGARSRVPRKPLALALGAVMPTGPDGPPVVVRDADGVLWLSVGHPTTRSGRRYANLSDVGRLPELARPLLVALVASCRGKATGTAWNLGSSCAVACRLLPVLGLGAAGPGDLPAELFSRLEAATEEANGRPLTPSQIQVFNNARGVFAAAEGFAHVDTRPRDATRRPREAWSEGPEGEIVPAAQAVFGDLELERLVKRCALEIREASEREGQFRRYLATGDADEPGPSSPELLEAARLLLDCNPMRPLTPRELRHRGGEWPARMEVLGHEEISRVAYPTRAGMVPFVTMLGLQSRLNPSLLGSLGAEDFSVEGGSGGADAGGCPASARRLSAAPVKLRSHRPYPVDFPVTDRPDEPAAILNFVEGWTERLRPFAGRAARFRFIFCTKAMRAEVLTFGQLLCERLNDALAELCGRANVPRITVKTLKLLGIDLIHERSNGDPMTMRAAGNWADIKTGVEHYFRNPAIRRDREAVAMALMVEDRRREHGISVTARPAGADLLSATDGWRCSNPFDSPDGPGEDGPRLCASVGICPICPHGDVDMAWPAWSLTRIVALLLAIEARIARDGAERAARLLPVPGEILDLWLPLFPPAIVAEASRLPVVEFQELPDAD